MPSDVPGRRVSGFSREAIEDSLDEAFRRATEDPVSALALADDALADIDRLDEGSRLPVRARAMAARGSALNGNGHYGEAVGVLRQALDLVPPDHPEVRTTVLQNLVVSTEKLGDLRAALDWAVQALEAARLTADDGLIAAAELAVGVGRSRCADPEGGLAHYRRVLAYYESTGNLRGCMRVLNNMGINLKNLDRLDEALEHQERAVALAIDLGSLHAAGVVRSNMGETLWRSGRTDEAREVLGAAIADLSGRTPPDGEINARVTYGRVLAECGDEEAAQAELELALKMIGDMQILNFAADAHLALAELHKSAGRFELALAHFEAYHEAERTQFDQDFERQVAALRVRLEVGESHHEAEVERLQLVEIGRAHEELKILHAALVAADAVKTELLARLDEESQTDALTGLLNRRSLDAHLGASVIQAHSNGTPLAVAMCDIDHFKRFNDEHGHLFGDAVLREVAELLRSRCRGTDIVARYGGEEFCIAFADTDLQTAVQMAERMRHDVAAHDWSRLQPDLQVTISIGVSQLPDKADHALLLASADAWLYAAKREGRNRVSWSDSVVHRHAERYSVVP
jgi:diguanylate cyclase (GGDEF)-like protein